MQIIHHITMDMVQPQAMLSLDAVQGDGSTRQLLLELTENGKPWTVPDGVTAAVAFRKKDGTKGLYDTLPDGTKAVTVSGNTVTAVLAPQVLSCAGEVSATVVFHDGKLNQLAAFPFSIWVKENPAAGQALSNDYYAYSTMKEVGAAVDAALASLETEKQAFLAKAQEALAAVHGAATEDAPAIVCEATGETITVKDASDRLLKGLTICGKTLQNGTPTPENPVPLESAGTGGAICVTVAGKNLLPYPYKFDQLSQDGVTVTANADGTITLNGTATAGSWVPITSTFTLPAGTYTIRLLPDSWQQEDGYMIWNGLGGLYGAISRTFKEATACEMGLVLSKGRTYINVTLRPQVEIGNTATEYEPYKGQTLTAATPGGLHGIGDVADEIDFARGVRVQNTRKKVFNGTENWNAQASGDTHTAFWTDISSLGNARNTTKNLCSHFSYDFNAGTAAATGFKADAHDIMLSVPNTIASTSAQMKAFALAQYEAGTPVTAAYQLATPMETPLSAEELAAYAALHSNQPNTTVFNDSGAGMKLGYVADTKTYIDNKFAAISAAMLNA